MKLFSKSRSSIRSLKTVNTPAPFNTRYGPIGGRSSNSGITATVFGAYGFLGRYVVNELGSCGSRVYVPFRGCELEVRHLKPMFDLGQLGLMPFSPRDEQSIIDSLRRSDVVINMIGKHYETKHLVPTRRADGGLSNINYGFDEVHAEIPGRIARLAKEAGVTSFIHMSALTASLDAKSRWSQSKAKGEIAVREAFPEAVIVRSGSLFGPEDRFLNLIAETAERLPFSPLIGEGQSVVQPVFARDVGRALMNIIYNHSDFAGSTFQLTGPAEYTYKEVVEFVSDVTTVKRPLLDIPVPIARLVAGLVEKGINPLLTTDGVQRLLENEVVQDDPALRSFHDVGIEAATMDKVAFDYLHRYRPGGHFKIVKGYY